MAVRLDIRPRLRLSPEPPAASRRRRTLPPFALPAAAYWLGMAALTYGFTQLGPRPLEALAAQGPAAPEPLREPLAPTEPEPAPLSAPEPAPLHVPEPAPPESAASSVAELAPEEPAPRAAPSRLERTPREAERLARVEEPRPAEPPLEHALPDSTPGAFPEFSDSSRPRAREHAADGPRIASLFERADVAPSAAAPSEPSPPEGNKPSARRPLTSCEAAVAHNNEQLEIGGPRGPADVTREAYASILQNGRFFADCRAPERTVIEICAAVKQGRAVGVTVVTNPASASLEACVRTRVAGLSFPSSERLDVTHTRFDSVKR